MKPLAAIGLRSAPGLGLAAWTMNEWLAFLSGVFVVLQIAHFLWKWRQEIEASRVRPVGSPRTKQDE